MVFSCHILHDNPGLSPHKNALIGGQRDFPKASRKAIRQGTLETVIKDVLWSIQGFYQINEVSLPRIF